MLNAPHKSSRRHLAGWLKEQARRRAENVLWITLVCLLVVERSLLGLAPAAPRECVQTPRPNASAKGEFLVRLEQPSLPSQSLAARLSPAAILPAPQLASNANAKPFILLFESAADLGLRGDMEGGVIPASLELAEPVNLPSANLHPTNLHPINPARGHAPTPVKSADLPKANAAPKASAAPAAATASATPRQPVATPKAKKTYARRTLKSSSGWIRLAAKQEAAGELDGALTSARVAAGLAKDAGEKQKVADILASLGAHYRARNQNGIAEIAYQSSLAVYEGLDPSGEPAQRGVADASNGLCAALQARGRYNSAQEMCERAIKHNEALGRTAALAQDYSELGEIHLTRNELDRAEAAFVRALNLHRQLQAPDGVSGSYAKLAQVAAARNEPDRAEQLFRKSIAMDSAAGRKAALALNYTNLGVLYAWKMDPANACDSWSKAHGLLGDGTKPQRERLEKIMREHSCDRGVAPQTP